MAELMIELAVQEGIMKRPLVVGIVILYPNDRIAGGVAVRVK